jgi:oxygen-independent coproporphyrinogen-3 oxidase
MVRAGYDHFVKNDDYLSKEIDEGTMAWNRLGIVSGSYINVLGVGVNTSCLLSNNLYYQNYFENEKYEESIDMGQLPISNHHVISNEDYMRGELIQTIRNYFRLDKKNFSKKYNINFNKYFKKNLKNLADYEKDNLLKNDENFIELTTLGRSKRTTT